MKTNTLKLWVASKNESLAVERYKHLSLSLSIYIYIYIYRKPARDNLILTPSSVLRELILGNRYKTKTKPYFLMISFIPKHETAMCNSRTIKRTNTKL